MLTFPSPWILKPFTTLSLKSLDFYLSKRKLVQSEGRVDILTDEATHGTPQVKGHSTGQRSLHRSKVNF
jgi:hypothetical protein